MITLNVQVADVLAHELQSLVNKGVFRDENEALTESIKLLLKRYNAQLVRHRILATREKLGSQKINLTGRIVRLHTGAL